MPNLTVTTQKTGNTITVSGTADAEVTCVLKKGSTVLQTKQATPASPPATGSWSVTFDDVTGLGPFQVDVSTADSKGALVGVPGQANG
jgi:hypothetical protein